MARKPAGTTNLGDLLKQAAKENLQSDITKQIHSSMQRQEHAKDMSTKKPRSGGSKRPNKARGQISTTLEKQTDTNNSVSRKIEARSIPSNRRKRRNQRQVNQGQQARKQKIIKFPGLTLLGGGSASKKKVGAKRNVRAIDSLEWGEDTDLSRVFEEHPEEFRFIGIPAERIRHQTTNEDAVELVIGLDFGTTLSKVVVKELGSRKTWAVPLSSNSRNPYLLRSEVFLDGGVYNLDQCGEVISGLKMPLLIGPADQDDISSVTGFLALVIKYVQCWVWNNLQGYLHEAEPVWYLNVGLPAKDFQNQELIRRYRAISWAAMLLASENNEDISVSEVERSYLEAENQTSSANAKLNGRSGIEVYLNQIQVFPEIMAQMVGFVRSRRWDINKPEFMLVDVGGGTLDQTIFNVVKDKKSGKLTFVVFKSSVEQMGTLRLHDVRLNWLLMKLGKEATAIRITEKLRNLSKDLARTWLVPNRIQDYLVNAAFGNYTIDDAFGAKVRGDVMKRLSDVLLHINPGFRNTKRRYPVVLAGGGAANPFYQGIAESQRMVSSVQTEPLRLPAPANLIAPGLTSDLYHRLSVAYGLAFEDLGELLTPEKIKDLKIPSQKPRGSSGMVTKEMT